MKIKLVLLYAFVLFVSLAYSNPIGPRKALEIASAYLPKDSSVEYVLSLRRSTRNMCETDTLAPLYVISRGENAGFVIVSGDDCLPGIIGYTDTGDFIESEMPPALLDMLEGYSRLIVEAQDAGAPSRLPNKVVEGRVSVEPIIKAHWHQSAPYNNLAPFITNTSNRALTGCTCTAAVMVLHHFRRDLPYELLATTPTYGYGDAPVTESYPKGTPILWDLMQYSYNGNYPDEMKNAVAVLNAAFGAGIWQTYGSSTSGQISKIVDGYWSYFNLGSTCKYKSGSSQVAWENLVYNNLVNGQPMVYAGVHATDGGHAIILDGYNASNGLFHFNFGWGGQGDGYYTLDDQTGINGFAGQQGMVYNIAPRKPNLTAKLHIAPKAYRRVETEIKISATNHGTLDYSGFNVYWGIANRVPSSTTDISASNTELVLSADSSGEFSVKFTPILDRTYYLYLTDKNLNVLDQVEVEVLPCEPSLVLQSFDISTSSLLDRHANENYRLLYNEELTVGMKIVNEETATATQTNLCLELFKCIDDNGSLELDRKINTKNYLFKSGATEYLNTIIGDLEEGSRYALYLRSSTNNNANLSFAEGVDSVIHFKVCKPTLQCSSIEGTAMTLKGEWDSMIFSSLASDTSVTSYDLFQVKGLNGTPKAANPNALFYTDSIIEGYNIVSNGFCKKLKLQHGYNFSPQSAFFAHEAEFVPQWNIDEGWCTLSLPFTAAKPESYICRKVVDMTTVAITGIEHVDTLYACKPYMVMPSGNNPIIANEVTVYPYTADGDEELPSFQAVISATEAQENTLVYKYDPGSAIQYFTLVEKGTMLSPFTGVIRSNTKKIRSYLSVSLDKSYKQLAKAISEAEMAYAHMSAQVLEEWNVLLTDSLSKAYDIFGTMQLGSVDVNKFTSNLLSTIEVYRLMLANVDSPICYTSLIANPSFESKSFAEWELTGDNFTLQSSTNLNYYGVGMDGNYLLYGDETENVVNSVSQTLHNLRSGYYCVKAMLGAGNDIDVTLFAGDSILPVKKHKWGRFYLDEYVIDSIWVETGALTIGVQSKGSWYKADKFEIYYLGDGKPIESDVEYVEYETEPIMYRPGIYDLFGRPIERTEMIPGSIYIIDGRKTLFYRE